MFPFVPLVYRSGILGLSVTALCVGVLNITARGSAALGSTVLGGAVLDFVAQNFAGDSVDLTETAQSAAAEAHFVNNDAVAVG